MEINQYLIDFYGSYDEDNRLSSRLGSIEFITTMTYIEKYLKTNDKILEIGAGTGRYSHTLSRLGYRVDAVELIEHNIEIFQKNTLQNENISIKQGNALDLSMISDNKYDITLLLGPLYHLYNVKDKKQAISEALRVTKKGGLIFSAHLISDICVINEGFKHGYFDVQGYINQGILNSESFAANFKEENLFDLVRKKDIDELMSSFPVTRLHYIATDGSAVLLEKEINGMSCEEFQLYLNYHLATCEQKDLIGMTSHALDIFKK